MPHINLLPWREELRKRRLKEFVVLCVVVAVATAGVMLLVHADIAARIDYQNRRNDYLKQQIALLNRKIVAIKGLDKEREALLARMQVIARLQQSRPEVVHLFDSLVQVLPQGVYYTRITQKGSNLVIVGVAQSNARVSSLMRNIDASRWLAHPVLVEIKAANQRATDVLRLSDFTLRLRERNPAAVPAKGKGG